MFVENNLHHTLLTVLHWCFGHPLKKISFRIDKRVVGFSGLSSSAQTNTLGELPHTVHIIVNVRGFAGYS